MKTALYRTQMKLQVCQLYFPQSKTMCHFNCDANFQLGPVWVKCGSSGGEPEAAAAARERAKGGPQLSHSSDLAAYRGAKVQWPDTILQGPWPLSAMWQPQLMSKHTRIWMRIRWEEKWTQRLTHFFVLTEINDNSISRSSGITFTSSNNTYSAACGSLTNNKSCAL